MRKLSLLLCAFILAFSTATYANNISETIDKPLIINGETYKIVRDIEDDNLAIKVVDKNSKEIWASIPLGYSPWNFKLNDKVSSLEIEDIDGDNVPEIITACVTGDIQSCLYVFKYDSAKKSFTAMNFGYVKYKDMIRDFMVSDIPLPNGENMVFETTSKIRCLGKHYTEDGPVPAYYYFELKNGEYMADDPVPVKIENNPSSPIISGQ